MAHIPLLLENIFSPHIKTSRKCLFFSTRIKKRDKSSGCFWYGVWHGTPNVFLIHILHTYMRRCQSSINKNPPSPLLSLFILISWDFVLLCVNISKSNPCSEKMLVFIQAYTSIILYFCGFFQTSDSSLLRWLFRPLNLCVPLILLLNRKVFTSNFF